MSTFKGAYNPQVLRTFSLAYMNEQTSFIATKVAPIVPVKLESAKIASYGADSIRLVSVIRATGANSNAVDLSVSLSTHYTLEDHAVHDYVPYEDYDNAEDPVDPQADCVEHLTELILVAKEYSLATAAQATATYTNSNYIVLSGDSKWSSKSTSDPIGDIITAILTVRAKSMKDANTLILAYDAMLTLMYHPRIRDLLGANETMTAQKLMDVLKLAFPGITNILVGKAQYNTANKGATMVIGDLWTDSCIVAYIEGRPRRKSRTFALTYQKSDEQMKVEVVKKNNNNENLTDRNADFFRVNDKYDQVIVDNACAYLLSDVI